MTEAWERVRIVVCFGAFGAIALGLVARLSDLQVVRDAAALRHTLSQEVASDTIAAPRGTIVDRAGDPLAIDRPVVEVRAQLTLWGDARADGDDRPRTLAEFCTARDRFASDVVLGLSRCAELRMDVAQRDALRDALRHRIDAALVRRCERLDPSRFGLRDDADGDATVDPLRPTPLRDVERIDVLVARDVQHGAVLEELRALDYRRCRSAPRGPTRANDGRVRYQVTFDFARRYERDYASPDVLFGLVGAVSDGAGVAGDDRIPVGGLEKLRVLLPREPGHRRARADAGRRLFWTADLAEPEPPILLHTTIDVGLSVQADTELDRAAEKVRASYQGSPPEWGALLLVDVPTGELLAGASWAAGKDGQRDLHGAFAPTSRVFQPGSVVKPLHVAMGLSRGDYGWDRTVDPARDGALSRSRTIREDHPLPVVDVHDILVQSSNVGAVRLGLSMGPQGIEDYLRHYHFGEPTAVLLPGERAGSRPADITTLNPREQTIYAGPSVLFGYQIDVTPLQITRAWLSFLHGAERELRLIRGITCDGAFRAHAAPAVGPRFLDPHVARDVRATLVDVLYEGTAKHIWGDLDGREFPRGLVGGKTGTSEYTGDAFRWDGTRVRASIRTASFACFAPVEEPRFLCVCVLQKVGATKFYGGAYAAPAAVRLLLRALDGA
ncbi:MAG: hypothetical protein IPM29_05460 [Planctomycetes bacterium]|nr:hypothetical protein [Planctomycetota bacterium]